jgi:HSP20 family molecular chaperone IbpA
MWSEALSMLDRAERLHRQFSHQVADAWEPPVDVVESGEELRVHIALPGVPADSITIGLEAGGITVSALRPFPCREEGAQIHRIEIPYGRYERRLVLPLADPYGGLRLAEKRLNDGVLTLIFRRKEGA